MNSNAKKWLIPLVAVGLIYILLRVWNLTASCLWFDEIFSIHAARHGWSDLFWFVAQDLIHPPLFYALLKIWIFAGGESIFWLRFFPVFFSVLSIAPIILLCRELKNSFLTITLALTFFAVNGSLIKYAQEVRMYSPLMCFGLFSLWLFIRFFQDKKSFAALLIFNILLVYTHYFGWFVVVSEVISVALLRREKIKHIFLMFGITFLSFVPWIYAVWQAAKINSGGVGQNIGWMQKPDLKALWQFFYSLFEPINFQQSNIDTNSIFLLTVVFILVGLAAFVFLIINLGKETGEENQKAKLILIFVMTPVLLAFIVSWIFPYSIWGTRHLIIVFAPFAILLAGAFSKINVSWLRIAALATIFLLFFGAFILQVRQPQPNYIWCAWENLATDLRSEREARVYVFEDLIAYHFWFAERDWETKFKVVKVNDIEGMTEDKAYFLPRGFGEIETVSENEMAGEKFWIAFRDKDWNAGKPPLKNLIEKGYRIGEPRKIEAQGLKAFLVEVNK